MSQFYDVSAKKFRGPMGLALTGFGASASGFPDDWSILRALP